MRWRPTRFARRAQFLFCSPSPPATNFVIRKKNLLSHTKNEMKCGRSTVSDQDVKWITGGRRINQKERMCWILHFFCVPLAFYLFAQVNTLPPFQQSTATNLPVHSTLQRFEFEEEFCCWPSILSTLRWLESEALPFHWVSFPSWCFENLLGQPSSMEMQPYGLFRSVVKVRTLLQQTHISSDNPKINTTWPKIKTGFLKKKYFVDMPTKHCWARKSTPDTMKESLLRLSARGWTEMDLCFPPNRQKLFHWWVQTHLWGTFQREKKQKRCNRQFRSPRFFFNVFSSFAKWWTRKADIFLFLPTRERVPDVCCLTVAFCKSTAIIGNWEWTQPSNDLFLYKENWVFEIPK